MNPVTKTSIETNGRGRGNRVTGSSGCRFSQHKAKAHRKMVGTRNAKPARIKSCERPTDLSAKTDTYFVSITDHRYPQKRAKKYKQALHDDWVERTRINAELEVNSDDGQPITVGNDYPHSLSSGVSATGSSRPMTQPNSDNKSEGGITDDAGEREEHGKLLGKAICGDILKSYYAGGSKALEMGVSIGPRLVHTLTCLRTDPLFGPHCPHHFSSRLRYKFPRCPSHVAEEGQYPSY